MQQKSSLRFETTLLGAMLAGLLLLPACSLLPGRPPKVALVSKWGRFERAFKSSVAYPNPFRDATLTVVFTSPQGEQRQVYGFWDGGSVWRVRFSPDQPGRWTFQTVCSDTANPGLNQQTGEFLCTAAGALSRFAQHGPVRVASDHRHFEHSDGTPFFLLADTAWEGARRSNPADWESYAATRAVQGFSAAQWSIAPGTDFKGQSAFSGPAGRMTLNLDFFRRLETKVEIAGRSGLLSAIVPQLEMRSSGGSATTLSDEQVILLLRYAVARWGTEPVVWLLAFDGGQSEAAARWKKIGRAVFAQTQHAPVVVHPGEAGQALDQFRDQSWVDAFEFSTVKDVAEDALKTAFTGPAAKEWLNNPSRPLIPVTPCENGMGAQPDKRFDADAIRHVACSSLLSVPPAGLCYQARGVVNWDTAAERAPGGPRSKEEPMWHDALFLPGAGQMTVLAKFIESVDFWRLRPQPSLLAAQPGDAAPGQFVAAAGAEAKDFTLIYSTVARTVQVSLEGLPQPAPVPTWVNPRTGQRSDAVVVVEGNTCLVPTPEPGDWLLLSKAGK